MRLRIVALSAAAGMAVAASGCGSDAKTFDIGPIFPLSPDKCARYHGDEKGTGVTATCMVSKEECEKATADWRATMRNSGVHDAILFTCD